MVIGGADWLVDEKVGGRGGDMLCVWVLTLLLQESESDIERSEIIYFW